MTIEGRYLDEILRKLYGELSKSTDTFQASKGKGQDLLGQKVVLKDPRSRISATATRRILISALAEFCWYMTGSADLEFIRFYIENYPPIEASGSLQEAYGPRLKGTGEFGYNIDQIARVISKLKKKPDTRRAVMTLLETSDLEPSQKEAPCTISLQFIRRRERLHLVAMMRSNDAYLGFPHDVFCFTMIQELVARSLGIQVGEYHHFATSLHLYETDIDNVAAYLDEGFQNPIFAMPKMPTGCQMENLRAFLDVERSIRSGKISKSSQISLPQYWRDLAIVLLRLADTRFKRGAKARDENFNAIANEFYKHYFVKRPRIITSGSGEPMVQSKLDLDGGQVNEN